MSKKEAVYKGVDEFRNSYKVYSDDGYTLIEKPATNLETKLYLHLLQKPATNLETKLYLHLLQRRKWFKFLNREEWVWVTNCVSNPTKKIDIVQTLGLVETTEF